MRELNKLTPLEIFLLIASLVITALTVWGLLHKVNEFEIQAKESQAIIEESTKTDKPMSNKLNIQVWRCSDDG